jgi:hypothetical protein
VTIVADESPISCSGNIRSGSLYMGVNVGVVLNKTSGKSFARP